MIADLTEAEDRLEDFDLDLGIVDCIDEENDGVHRYLYFHQSFLNDLTLNSLVPAISGPLLPYIKILIFY